jgi:RNA polymerase sigma-70 factor (ECF subfamily)
MPHLSESIRSRGNLFVEEALPHFSGIQRAALRQLRSQESADDVTQEVYLRAWQSFDRFTAGTNCKAWLHQILTYTLMHHWRKEQRYGPLPAAIENLPGTWAGPDQEMGRISDPGLIGTLDRLPAPFREVLMLVDVKEYSYREAASSLGIPIGTVMSRLSRARRQMRGMMNGTWSAA